MWEHGGIICTGETYKAVVKLTFAKGAALDDPSRLFNSSLEGNVRRAIDIREGDKIDEQALMGTIYAAVALNVSAKVAVRSRSKADGRAGCRNATSLIAPEYSGSPGISAARSRTSAIVDITMLRIDTSTP